MSNNLILKRQIMIEKAKKKQELVAVKTNYLKTTKSKNNIKGFEGLHETELKRLCEEVNLPKDYQEKCCDDRTPAKYKSDMKKHYKGLTDEARRNCVFIKKSDDGVPERNWDELDVESERKSDCLNFLDGLEEFVE